jgi:octaprenyl-diphosphate synthase
LCGYRDDDCISYAAVIDFIHTATLLHDDVWIMLLPKGYKDRKYVWGNEASVLAGRFLYAKAFE